MKTLRTSLIVAGLVVIFLINTSLVSVQARPLSAAEEGIDQPSEVDALQAGLGQMFGMFRQFGASGETFAAVFQLLLTGFVNMSSTEKLDGVYVMNASYISDPVSDVYEYPAGHSWEYDPWGVYNLGLIPGYENEYPYLIVEETGTLTYNRTDGVSITFIIWDENGSFIDAIDNLIQTVREFQRIQEEVGPNPTEEAQQKAQEAAIKAAVRAITYFLIHINDIITGDEVIITNIIAFTNYASDFDGSINATWYVTENGHRTNTILLADVFPSYEAAYRALAEENNDEYMQYILDEGYLANRFQNYTRFSFDIIELWLKEFQISIDVEAILAAVNQDGGTAFGNKTATDIFQELKLEFYLFTHHFSNYYLYDDTKFDDPIYNESIRAKANNDVPDIVYETIGEYEGETVERISHTEVEDYLLMRGVEQWTFQEPEYDTVNKKMSWGVRADGVAFRVMPIGMQDDQVDLTIAPVEHMEYFELGFSFEPYKRLKVDTSEFYINAQGEKTMGSAKVKLVQKFGDWELDGDSKPFTPHLKNQSMDLAAVYMSTIFHFRLAIENRQITSETEAPSEALLNESNYDRQTSKVKVGDVSQELPLAEIDIAGPNYTQAGVSYPASTTTIPTVYAEWEGKNSQTYTQEDNSTGRLNATINLDFSVIIYAVAYPTFSSTGQEIVHDPTFSIFIVSQNPGLWAVILVVGSVVLVGVAAILITRKKEAALV